MRRQGVTKVQLFILFGAIGLVMWSMSNRTGGVEGIVVMSDMSDGHVYRTGMRVERDADILISMTGSFESDASRAPLATYGWIINAEDRSLVWQAERSQFIRDGVLGIVTDSIHLAAGSYDVFYTTEGPSAESRSNAPFLGLKPFWTNDTSKWSLSISQNLDVELGNPDVFHADYHGSAPAGEDLLWTSGIVGNRSASTHLFRVSAQADVSIYSIGEICPRECDYGYIENVQDGSTVWKMDWDNTTPAGGVEVNRVFQGTIVLEPGIYRAGYQSNGSHSAKSWRANPPHDPDGWGLTLSNVPRANVMSYNPWTQTTPFIDMTGVGDDELRKTQFKVSEKSTFLISALGEITSSRSLYDYGWLERNDSHETIWKMSYENSNRAGGDTKNRVETVFLELEPGTYTIYFQTDDSHSSERFNSNSAKPDNPERWGLAVFPVSTEGSEDDAYSLITDAWGEEQQMDNATASALLSDVKESAVLISFERMGNDAQVSETFELSSPSKVLIIGAGELSSGSRQDYGWIENAESGERIWEMTAKNTDHAGGRKDNRLFEGLVQLPAGQFIARYVTDFSHAYGDFGELGPDDETLWGMRIIRMDQ